MEHLGEELKSAREAAGLSIRELATRTKISTSALEALERNDFSRLPGGIFGRSFVRAYALEVGVDPDTTVARFIDLLEQSEREAAERRAARRPAITQDDRQFLERQKRALILLRVVLVLVAIGLVALVTWRVRVMLAQPAVAEVAAPLPAPPVVAPPAPVAVPAPAAPVDASAVMTIELDVTGECWISLSADGGTEVARLYRAGEHERIEVTRELVLDVGNAGALQLSIDGKPGKPLGASAQRIRTRITRQNSSEFLQ